MASFMFAAMMERICDFQRTFLELEGRCISYRDVVSETARLAHALQTLGVKPGDRVAVQVEKSPEALLLYLACVRAGSVFVPLNTAYTRKELEYFIGDAEPTLVVCRPEMVNAIQQVCSDFKVKACETLNDNAGGSLLQLAASQERVFRDVERGPEDIAAILYTSGTTGRSKGAMLTHQNLTSNALTLVDFWQFTEQDVLLHALPIFHTHGLFVATNVALFAGAKILLLRKFDAEAVLRLMPHATVMMGVPTFYTRLLQNRELTPKACASMRLFISGSAPLPAETHREWRVRTGHAILERYGMTETNMNTSNPYEGERIAGTVGIPLPGVSSRVTDPESGSLLATDQVGMIEVTGPNVFKGYWRNPEKTKSEFRENGFYNRRSGQNRWAGLRPDCRTRQGPHHYGRL